MKILSLLKLFCGFLLFSNSFAFTNDDIESSEYLKPRHLGNTGTLYPPRQDVTRENQYNSNLAYIQHGFSTSHPGGIHHLLTFNPGSQQVFPFLNKSINEILSMGTTITLDDGSVWSLWPAHSAMAKTWLSTDQIAITRRYGFDGCSHSLQNLTLGSDIPVNLSLFLRPDCHTALNRRILTCDPLNNTLVLDDLSEWSLGRFAYLYQINDWRPEDTIIICLNGDMFPKLVNVLLNCRLNLSVEALCTKQPTEI